MAQSDRRQVSALIYQQHRLQLGTWSLRCPGFPHVSLCQYIMGYEGLPVLLLAEIAEHSQHLSADARCSFLVAAADPSLQAPRVTWLAEALRLPEAQIPGNAWRYYQYFPEMQGYHASLNFHFWMLRPLQGRWIGGFGRALWLDWQVLDGVPAVAREQSYLERWGGLSTPWGQLVGVDPWGMDFSADALHRHQFLQPATTVAALEQALEIFFAENS